MKTNKISNLIIIIMTGLLLMMTAFTSKAQKMDSLYYYQTHKGKIISLDDVYTLHESDFLLSHTVNGQDSSESIFIFYNDTPVNFEVYIFYVVRGSVVISSRCVKIYPLKPETSEIIERAAK